VCETSSDDRSNNTTLHGLHFRLSLGQQIKVSHEEDV
jgi:hypothetical protein